MLYYDAGRLVEFLIKWKSDKMIKWKSDKKDFFSRILDLSIAMVREGFWGIEDALLTEAWIADLVSNGYKMPVLKNADKLWRDILGEIELLPKEQLSSYLRTRSDLELLRSGGIFITEERDLVLPKE